MFSSTKSQRVAPETTSWEPVEDFTLWKWICLPLCLKTRRTIALFACAFLVMVVASFFVGGRNVASGNILIVSILPFLGPKYRARRLGNTKPKTDGVEVFVSYVDLERGVYGHDYGTLALQQGMLRFDGDRTRFALQTLDVPNVLRAPKKEFTPYKNFTRADELVVVHQRFATALKLECMSSQDMERYKAILEIWETSPVVEERSVLPPTETDPCKMWFALHQLVFNLAVSVVFVPSAVAMLFLAIRHVVPFSSPLGGPVVFLLSIISATSVLYTVIAISSLRNIAKQTSTAV